MFLSAAPLHEYFQDFKKVNLKTVYAYTVNNKGKKRNKRQKHFGVIK